MFVNSMDGLCLEPTIGPYNALLTVFFPISISFVAFDRLLLDD
jgi:hypothetical protein